MNRRSIFRSILALLVGKNVVKGEVKPQLPFGCGYGEFKIIGFDPAIGCGDFGMVTRGFWKDGVLHITSQERITPPA